MKKIHVLLVSVLLVIMFFSCVSMAQTQKPKLALLLFSRGFEFMVALDEGAKAEAARQGVDIVVLDGQSSSEVQSKQIDDLIASGISAIILSPANSEEIVPAVRRANNAGVPVVSVDAIVATGGKIECHVGFDNAAGGRMAAEYIAEKIGKKGIVLELMGALGAYHAQQRHAGFLEGMSKYPDIEVISQASEWVADKAQKITTDVLTAKPEVKAIFSHNDEMLVGTIPGLRQINQLFPVGDEKHIVVVGIDGTPSGLTRIREGWQDASVQQDPFDMGAKAVQVAIKVLNKEEVPPSIFIEPLLITKENVEDQSLWANKFKK